MSHNHDHAHSGHSHSAVPADGHSRIFLTGICLNIAFVLAEIVAGLVCDSIALLTDAGHNISDVAGLILSLLAFRFAKKKATQRFTYGYKKTTVLAAFVNAVILLVAVGVLGYESITRLRHPAEVQGKIIAWVAALGILINSISAYLFFRNRKEDLNVKSAYLHLLSDALVSAAVVLSGLIISYTHWYWLDPVAGLLIMIVILGSTWGLLRDSFNMAVDAVPPGIDIQQIRHKILTVQGVVAVHHIHVWSLSTAENALTAHVLLKHELDFSEKIKVVGAIRHELEHLNIHHSTIEMDETPGPSDCGNEIIA